MKSATCESRVQESKENWVRGQHDAVMPLATGHHFLGFGIIGNDLGINYCFFRCVNPEHWVHIDEVDEPTHEICCFQHLMCVFLG
jgi:hypothetical protein